MRSEPTSVASAKAGTRSFRCRSRMTTRVYDSFVRDRLPGAASGIPLRPAGTAISRAAERCSGTAEGRRAATRWRSSTITAAGPTPSSTISAGRIARLLVEEHGLIPGNRVLLRGPNGYTIFAAWLGVLKAGGVVVATMPLLRPGEIATVIERAQISHAIVDSRFIGDFRQAVEQTHFVKHIIKYDGDYGRGELETRTASLQPLPPVDTGRDDPASSPSPAAPPACPRAASNSTATCSRRATRSRSISSTPSPATSSSPARQWPSPSDSGSPRCSRCASARLARRSNRVARRSCSKRLRSSE